MNILETSIPDIYVVENTVFRDDRGEFSRLFCSSELQPIIGPRKVVQINHSMTRSVGAVRGLHFQNAPYAEMKIIRCLRGRVFDVAVDLRFGSPTFLKWNAVELTPESNLAYVIPEGCAHGFQVLEENSQLLYMHTEFYTPGAEGAVRFDDPHIAIDWPIEPKDLSERDLKHPYVKADYKGIVL